MYLRPLLLLLGLFALACDGDATTATTDTSRLDSAPETAGDATDARADEDVPEPDDAAPDTTDTVDTADSSPSDTDAASDDTTSPDAAEVTPDPCAEQCPAVSLGPTGVSINSNGLDEAPTLAGLLNGSEPMRGLYELEAITVYSKGAFDGVLIQSADVSDFGQTSGTVRFEDGHWAYLLDLDLLFSAQTALGPSQGPARNEIIGGGCFSLESNLIVGDTASCANAWPFGTTPPTEAEFAYDAASGRFLLKVVLSREFIIALLPPEYAFIGNAAIVGPIRFIAGFRPQLQPR